MLIVLVSAACVIFIIYQLRGLGACAEPSAPPRLGKPGLIGYITTALRFTMSYEKILQEGWDKFSGRPFIVPTLAGSLVVLGPNHLELLRKSDDAIFNQPLAVCQMLQIDYTLNEKQRPNPYYISVVTTDVTRAIGCFIPDVTEETALAMQETFAPFINSKPVSLPVFHTMTHMIARVNNRTVLGTDLCRNTEFTRAIINFVTTLPLYGRVLRCLPRPMRPIAYLFLSSLFGGQKEPKKFLVPYLERYLDERDKMQERSKNVAEFFVRKYGHEKAEDLAMRVMFMNFATLHSTSIFLTQALFELSVLPKSDLESIRTEVIEALEMEGGWNKAALTRFRMIDSLLKEVGRFHGLGVLPVDRLVIRDAQLEDGTRIPAGHTVRIYSKPVHFNPQTYPNPRVFDAFRFSRLHGDEGSDTRSKFATINHEYLAFGIGRHACPGRFFAAMVLKITIAHLLLNYEISLPMGVKNRPRNISVDGNTIPDPKAELVFKRRPHPHGSSWHRI